MLTSAAGVDTVGHELRRAAIVGAGGFIGTRLSSALTRADVDTACFTRSARAIDAADELSYALHHAPVVHYLASSINPVLGERRPDLAVADHKVFDRVLVQLAERADPPTVVLTSSGGTVYDQHVAPPYSERSPVRATTRYGAAKVALERALIGYPGPSVIVRLSNAYGPGQVASKAQGVLGFWLRAVLDGDPLRVIGDPASSRDYVYIDDVVDCMQRIDSAARAGRFPYGVPKVLNLGSGMPTSLAELVEVVQNVVGRDVPVRHEAGRALDRPHVWLDVSQARQILGWCPRISLVEGVTAMWRWTRDRDHRQQQSVNSTEGAQQWY